MSAGATLRAQVEAAAVDGRLFALGKNAETQALGRRYALAGVLDDRAAAGARWQDWPLVVGDALPADACVVHCASAIAPVDAARRVEGLTGRPCIGYAALAREDTALPAPWMVADMQAELAAHPGFWATFADRLGDAESRQVFTDLLAYRRSGDWRVMADYRVRIDEQYFEPFLELGRDEVFVDAGGFDGATTEAFFQHCPAGALSLFFEPSPANMALARSRLPSAVQARMRFFPYGLSDHDHVVRFDADAGSASAPSPDGALALPMTTLDACVADRVDLLKMDLEGHELAALRGAQAHVRRDHPRLAIAVYHAAKDLRETVGWLDGVRRDYRLYLRHYTQGWSETILFALPDGARRCT